MFYIDITSSLEPIMPNPETQRVLKETDEGIGLVECEDVDDLFDKLGI